MYSQICDFYSFKSVFITGATGLVGKALIEKLLRSCDEIERIYILMRHKKSKTAKQRSDEYTSDPIFALNSLNETQVCLKIHPISGDTSLPGLGISAEDRQLLIDNVNVVIHLAANVKLNPSLCIAIRDNLKPIIPLIELCHQIKRLECLVYSSSVALLNGTDNKDEVISTNIGLSPQYVIKACDECSDEELKKLREFVFFEFNNTYCISKALAEQLLLKESSKLKISIVRPSAILGAYDEPMPGWVQGKQGTTAAGILVGLGLMKVFPTRSRGAQCVIPVDFVANAIISSACDPNLEVYNLTTKTQYSPPMRFIMNTIKRNAMKYPSKRVVRPPRLLFSDNKYELRFKNYIKHWIFAYIIAFIAKLNGIQSQVLVITDSMTSTMKDIRVYLKTAPDFWTNNTFLLIESMSKTDRNLFNFDIRGIDWKYYCDRMWLGCRRYILKEKDEDIHKCKRTLKRITIKFHILNTIWLSFVSIIFYFILYLTFNSIGFGFCLPSLSTITNPNSVMDLLSITQFLILSLFCYKCLSYISFN